MTGVAPQSRASVGRPRRPLAGAAVSCGVTAHGRPSKSAADAAKRAGALAAGHRVAADVAGELVGVHRPATSAQRGTLDAADVGDDGAGAAQRLGDLLGEVVRGDGDDHQLRADVVRVEVRRRPRPVAMRRCSWFTSLQRDVDARRARSASADRRAEQAGADDEDRALKHSSGTSRTRVRSRRRAAAPCR